MRAFLLQEKDQNLKYIRWNKDFIQELMRAIIFYLRVKCVLIMLCVCYHTQSDYAI